MSAHGIGFTVLRRAALAAINNLFFMVEYQFLLRYIVNNYE
mgnify:CR=1 FL=1